MAKQMKNNNRSTGNLVLLKPLAKENPCRPGTFCYAQVEAALHSKDAQEAQRKLNSRKDNPTKGRRIEIGWMVRNKIIKAVTKKAA